MTADGSVSTPADVLSELRGLRGRNDHVQGSIVATTDGLVIAHDLADAETFGIEPEGVAALSAVNLGLSQRIADTASHGDVRETVIRGAFGHVITCAAGDRAILSVLVRSNAEILGLSDEAHHVAGRVAGLLAS